MSPSEIRSLVLTLAEPLRDALARTVIDLDCSITPEDLAAAFPDDVELSTSLHERDSALANGVWALEKARLQLGRVEVSAHRQREATADERAAFTREAKVSSYRIVRR